MRTLSTRARLTAWYFLIVAAALVAFALFALSVMRQSIFATVDEQLRDRAYAIQSLLTHLEPEADVADELREHAELQSGSELFQVSDSTGRFLYRSQEMDRLGVAASPSSSTRLASLDFEGLPLRILSTTSSTPSGPYLIQVAEPMDDYLEAIERFRSAMLIGIPVLLLAAVAVGYWMSIRTLQPVDQITRQAQRITPKDLSSRVVVPRTGDELQRLAETLNQLLQRIDAAFTRITQFTADASHELRTPLALIRTRAEVTLGKPRTNDEYQFALREIQAESERTSTLIENLMLLARADTGTEVLNFQTTDIVALTSGFSAQARTLSEAKGLNWRTELPEQSIWVKADAQALRRLMLILADNAIKYTPPGGSVELAVVRAAGDVEIRVRDTGIGISEADLPHIFERFYRADKARSREVGGAGLGLSIGGWIAESHGGRIVVESSSSGTTFIVRLPVAS